MSLNLSTMMAFFLGLLLFLTMAGHSNAAVYCLCKDGMSSTAYQNAIDYACGHGGDCSAILTKGGCFQPNTLKSHCDFAVNTFYQNKGQAVGTCDFTSTATTSSNPPTTVTNGCVYPTGPSNTMTPTTPTTPSTTTPSTMTPPSSMTPTTTGTNPSVFPGTGFGPTSSINDNAAVAVFVKATNLSFSLVLTLWFSGFIL